MRLLLKIIVPSLILTLGLQAHAWGRRGHSIVCQTAAYLASQDQPETTKPFFLKGHSFDLGYYCNVPDIIWKRPATYKKEFFNHFMDLELFDQKFSKTEFPEGSSPFDLTRPQFNKKYKDLPDKTGRSWWRLKEVEEQLSKVTTKLKDKKLSQKEHQDLQTQWLFLAGVMGHYVGDLAMPLHVSANYDGKATGQKGIHGYFEETLVDELFLQRHGGLQESVYKKALSLWPSYQKQAEKKDFTTLVKELSRNSEGSVKRLLKIDKKTGRKSLKKASKAFRSLIVERLAKGAVLEAIVLKSHLGWDFDGEKYYQFMETPDFIETPGDKGLPKK